MELEAKVECLPWTIGSDRVDLEDVKGNLDIVVIQDCHHLKRVVICPVTNASFAYQNFTNLSKHS